jgi:serine/threonine protein kinase/Tfp pilus assembly protein PilF
MIGQIISHYKIIEKLGEGGMGVVYKAHDNKLDRYVALKFLPTNLTASSEDVQRFELEAKAISALNHPNIATIHDVDEFNGQKYLVLEYISGGTLKSKLKQLKSEDKEFSISEVVNYGIQLAEGLAHAHRHQIIHRDVKTDNMMLTEDSKVKLTDFGLAKLRGGTQLTKTGSTLGTAAYMSPEQIRGEDVDHRTDIFSFGVVLYELVTSHLPFKGEFEAALSYSILNESPTPIKSLRQNVPQAFEQIINHCLEKDKTKRFQSLEEISVELRKVQQELSARVTVVSKYSKLTLIVASIIVVLAFVGIYLFYPASVPTSANSKTIAVLPFSNISGDQEDEYFTEGVMEDILTQLSKIADLNVISRTTMIQYKNTKKSLKEIGKELNAGVILEGSVRHSGNRTRITSQLIDAETDKHIWAETYDRDMKDVFAVQSDVAKEIAYALKAKFSMAEKIRIEKEQTENTEAYQLYLKGRFFWNKRRAEDLQTAIGYFNQAIEKDPGYALAYAGLASTYVLLPERSGLPSKEAYLKAKAWANKALELDGTLAEAYAVLGLIKATYDWDWSGAEREYKKAIELNPSYATTHHWYNLLLRDLDRIEEALAEIKRAEELDPLSLIISVNVGLTYRQMRQYDKAIEQLKKVQVLDPNYSGGYFYLGMIYAAQGQFDQAIVEIQKDSVLTEKYPLDISCLGHVYGRAGKRKEALRMIDKLVEISKHGVSTSDAMAFVYFGLDEKDKAFQWLEKAYDERSAGLRYFISEPLLDEIQSDSRFITLLRKMGLEK